MSVDFGKFKRKGKDTTTERTPSHATEVSQPTKVADRGRTDYKKKYESGEKELRALRKSHTDIFNELTELKAWADAVKKEQKEMYELKDEIHRLRVQGNMDKKALNQVTMQLVKFQFDPQKFSQLAQVLTYMRLHGTKAALRRVKEIVGNTEIIAVRKWIFDLLEAPYK